MNTSSWSLYSGVQTRELDRLAIEDCGIAAVELMQRAGTAVFSLMQVRWPRASRPLIVCGGGNNGGDGYVVARLARAAGLSPRVVQVGTPSSQGPAAKMRAACSVAGVSTESFTTEHLVECDIVIDAILGIGLTQDVRNDVRRIIEAINNSGRPVIAVDVPSGLHSDTGAVMGAAVRANMTLTFIGVKTGLYTGKGREFSGEIMFDSLDVPDRVYERIAPHAQRISDSSLKNLQVQRPRYAHKGNYGHVLVVGGDRGMPGAPRLAGEAAYRTGAGLVTVATYPEHSVAVAASCAELLVQGVSGANELRPLLMRANTIALGPGLGQSAWSQEMFTAVLETRVPLVIDADALNLLALDPMKRSDWVITPHPGEAGRLLGCSTNEIQADRFHAVRELQTRYGGVCVLKGSGTLIAAQDQSEIMLCDRGNPGMASGGMGDVLTGIIVALLAQGMNPFDAARLGVWAHATAGDLVAQEAGEIGLMASDLIPQIRVQLNRLATHATN